MAYKILKGRLLFQIVLVFQTLNLVESQASSFFTKIPFFKLDGDIIQTIAVPNIFQCCWRCDRIPSCLSINKADRLGIDGLYECQMLRNWTGNKYSGLIKESQDYHHYTRLTEICMTNKCLNGGTCEAIEYDDFRCRCPKEFKGKVCEKTYAWQKINTSPVCFGAKNSSFGRFYVNQAGLLKGMKLVHVSGFVATTPDKSSQSKWGSAGAYERLYAIITNNSNNRILPQDEFISDFSVLSYALPGFNYNSKELIFKNFTSPRVVTAGEEFRIWYGEDLNNNGEEDNAGASCADVFVLALFD